jgi:sigma-B regulation protein RsbU (phosphoserine phosphatase)
MNILVVEDDSTTQTLLLGWLQEWDHRVATARTGPEALELIEQGGFDLVLSNWTLADLDGLALCRHIRDNPGPTYCYIILYTLKAGELDFVAGMDAGADDFISIPLEAGRLRVRLRAAERV